MNLILGSHHDGWGRIRITFFGLLLLITAGLPIGFGQYHQYTNPDEQRHFDHCVSNNQIKSVFEEREPEDCRAKTDSVMSRTDKMKKGWYIAGTYGLGVSVFFWLFTGLLGWIYRGFAGKEPYT